MRLVLDTLVRWLIAAALFLGAISYFRLPQNAHYQSLVHFNVAATVIVISPVIVLIAFASRGISRWLVPFIFAIGTTLGIGGYYGIQGRFDVGSEPINIFISIAIVVAVWLMIFHIIARTHRFLMLLSCWCDPNGLKTWFADLDSPRIESKSLAVQTLADYLGLSIAGAENWHFTSYRADELDAYVVFIKKLWESKQAALEDCPSQEKLLQRLGRNIKQSFGHLHQYRLDWTPPRMNESFQQTDSDSSDEGGRHSSAAQEPITESAGEWQATSPPSVETEFIEAVEASIKGTLEEVARIMNEAPAGSMIVECEEPVGALFAQLFLEAYQLGLSLRLKSSDIEFPDSRTQAPVWRLSDGGFLTATHFFEAAGKYVKDALTDLNLIAEEVEGQSNPEDLPFMAADEFVLIMLPHVEDTLKKILEIIIRSPSGLILVAEEPGVCRFFAQLHARALELGLELRLRAAENLGLFQKPKTIDVAIPNLRRAASPPIPPGFMGWADKYRRMKIAGTRFPLIREGPLIRESSKPHDDPPITSVKRGPDVAL